MANIIAFAARRHAAAQERAVQVVATSGDRVASCAGVALERVEELAVVQKGELDALDETIARLMKQLSELRDDAERNEATLTQERATAQAALERMDALKLQLNDALRGLEFQHGAALRQVGKEK